MHFESSTVWSKRAGPHLICGWSKGTGSSSSAADWLGSGKGGGVAPGAPDKEEALPLVDLTDGGVAPAGAVSPRGQRAGAGTLQTTLGGELVSGPLPQFICASYGFRRLWEDLGVYRHWNNKNCRDPTHDQFEQAVQKIGLTASESRVRPMLLVRCMAFHDPDKDSSHLGAYWRNMRAIAEDTHFREVAIQVRDFLRRQPWARRPERTPVVMLLFWCRSGNHRSVASCELIHYCMQRAGFKMSNPDHMARQHWWRKCGFRGPCDSCDPRRLPNTRWERENRDALEKAFEVYLEVDGPIVETSACPLVL